MRARLYWAPRELGSASPSTRGWASSSSSAERHLRAQVKDPALRAKLTPDYRIGCKRVLISQRLLSGARQPNVELLTEGLAEVRGNTVVGSDGTEREVDAIIFGTGFDVTGLPGPRSSTAATAAP